MAQTSVRRGLELIERSDLVEAGLWRRWWREQDINARQDLFERYRPWARRIAGAEFHKRPLNGAELNDAVQLAYLGLLEAMDRFEPNRGVPFIAFAHPRLVGQIADGLAISNEDGSGSRGLQKLKTDRIRSILQSSAQQKTEETADPLDRLRTLVNGLALGILAKRGAAPLSLEIQTQDDRGWRELCLSIAQCIDRMPEPERFIMQGHYYDDMAFNTLARVLKVSPSRISQRHHHALDLLRGCLGLEKETH